MESNNGVMQTVLVKVIARRFYESHAGLFLFVFFLMFGTVESSQLLNYHTALIHGVLNAPVFLLVVLVLWTLYWLKCLLFVWQRFDLAENEILYRLNLLSLRQQFAAMVPAVVAIGSPVLVYAMIIVGFSVRKGPLPPGIEILLFHTAMICMTTWLILRKVNSPHRKTLQLKLPQIFRWTRPRPFAFFYLHHLTHQGKMMLWVTKVFSILAIVGFLQIPSDGYDVRIALLGFLFGLAAHAVIVFEFRRFEDLYLNFTRNLPLTLNRRLFTLFVVYAIVLLPEAVLLLVNRLHPADVAAILMFATGFLLFIHNTQYVPGQPLDMDKHLVRLLGLFLISFMLVLMKIYLLEAVALWGLSWYFYHRNFFGFEGIRG